MIQRGARQVAEALDACRLAHRALRGVDARRLPREVADQRLLAREVYDRVVAAKGEAACALITGEEKIELRWSSS